MNKPQLILPFKSLETTALPAEPWRPIHYLGSKLRIVKQLEVAIDAIAPGKGPVCDLFAGSGTVSAALSISREVLAVDIQEYSRVICSAIFNSSVLASLDCERFLDEALNCQHETILRSAQPLIDYERLCLQSARAGRVSPLCELIEHASTIGFCAIEPTISESLLEAHRLVKEAFRTLKEPEKRSTLVFRHFGGLYFSYDQACQLDALLTAAHGRAAPLRDCLLAAIASTASEVVNTVGKHFAQPIRPRAKDGRPKTHLINKVIRDRELDVVQIFRTWIGRYRSLPPTQRIHRAIRSDFEEFLADPGQRVSVVYADPPYTRDHYSRFYHVLETMCLWDEPPISTTRIRSDVPRLSRGMYRADRHQSPFCIESEAPSAFYRLFKSVSRLRVPLVLSYSPYATDRKSRPRVMTIDAIRSIARESFSHVELISAGRISHSKLNSTKLNAELSYDAEVILVCK